MIDIRERIARAIEEEGRKWREHEKQYGTPPGLYRIAEAYESAARIARRVTDDTPEAPS